MQPPAALRFAYDGASADESAVLHGLAAAYEGLFRLDGRLVNGKPAYRHILKPDKWIAFTGSGWMAQHEGALGTDTGVLLLRDTHCATPDLSGKTWKVTPGWKPDQGLRCIGMSEEEADRYEEESNPWGAAAGSNAEMDALAAQLKCMPLEELAALPPLEQREYARQQLQLEAKQQMGVEAPPHPAGAPMLVRLPGGVLYLGKVDHKKRPHGEGELLLRDGSVHAGHFESGAAHGEGVYFDRGGAVHCGFWVTNFRVGEFGVIDPSGSVWDDARRLGAVAASCRSLEPHWPPARGLDGMPARGAAHPNQMSRPCWHPTAPVRCPTAQVYDQWGKRVGHARATDGAQSARRCRFCPARFHPQHNYKCRRHKGAWQPATATRPARWSCCAAIAFEEPGCHVTMHEADDL